MQAKDLMRREVFTVRDDTDVSDLIEMLVREHIHGAPVVDGDGMLVGIVTQQDVFFSGVTRAAKIKESTVRDIMTSPAISATEDTDLLNLCRMMHRLRIHRVPIVNDSGLVGIVSSLDICAALAQGRLDLGGKE